MFLLSGSTSSSLFWWIRLQEWILSYRNIKLPHDDRALAAKCSWYNNSLHVLITSSDLITTVGITVTVLWVHHSAAGISQLRRLLSSEDFRTARMSIFFHFRTLCTLCCLTEVRQKHVIKDWVNCLGFKEKETALKQRFSRADQRPEISDITLQFWVLQQLPLLLPPLIYHLLKVLMPPGSKFDGSDKRRQ